MGDTVGDGEALRKVGKCSQMLCMERDDGTRSESKKHSQKPGGTERSGGIVRNGKAQREMR